MPIKCTLGDIDQLRGRPGQAGILEKIWNAQFPSSAVADAFRASRFCRALLDEVKGYEAQLLKLARPYGEQDKEGRVLISPENNETFAKAKAELDAVEHEVQTVPLRVSVLEHLTTLTPSEAHTLEKFVEGAADY